MPTKCWYPIEVKDIIHHIWNARPYTPEGIVAGADTWDLVIQDDSKESTPYPFGLD